jgi:phosphotransacetylase
VAGDEDILVSQDFVAGNILTILLTGRVDGSRMVVGAKSTIKLTSRADDARTKLATILWASWWPRHRFAGENRLS